MMLFGKTPRGARRLPSRVCARVGSAFLLLWIGMPLAHAATFTVTKTADTNDGVCNADCSLREAITAANGNGVPDTIAFNIPLADPGYNAGTGVFTITVSPGLPAITNDGTTIDGTTQTTNVGNTNATVLGTGGTVGVGLDGVISTGDEQALSQVAGPEIEIRDGAGATYGLWVQSNSTTIRGLAILGFGAVDGDGGIRIDNNFTGTLIEQNVLGSFAHTFTDPGAALRNYSGLHSEGGDLGILRYNLVGFGTRQGIWLINGSNNWSILGNEVRDSGLTATDGDGIALAASALNTVTANLVTGSSSQGIVINGAGSNNNTVVENTVTGNGVGTTASVIQSTGVTVRGSGGPTAFLRNVIHANYGAGLAVNNGANSITMTQNSFADNGTIIARDLSPATGQIGIDLNATGDDNNFGTAPFFNINDDGDGDIGGNDIDNFAVIEQAQIIGANLVVSGFSATGAAIEFYISDGDPSGFGEGETFLFTASEGSPQDSDLNPGSYGPGPVNGIAQGTETNIPRFRFSVPLASLPAPVGSADKLVATSTAAGQTSEFSGQAPIDAGAVAGTIFEDISGDGLADGPLGGAANPGTGSVTVYLYDDTGGTAGQPDATDGSLGSTTTAGDGSYVFAGLPDGSYWVFVDSRTLSADANVWAEQTYGPSGGWCADGAGGTTQGIGAAGGCYGGRRVDPVPANPSSDDLTAWHSGAEHLAQVTIAGGVVSGVDFGFSVNVVTTTRGGDTTDDDGATPRSVQGSMRQFIQNANAVAGGNRMRFVPAEPTNASAGADNWWQINVTTTFDSITGDTTTVDGSAYDRTNGITLLDGTGADPTPGLLGTGGNVGVTPVGLSQVSKPELELRGTAASNGITVNSNDSTVRRLAARRFASSIVVSSTASGALVEENVLGTGPSAFADPGVGERNAATGISGGVSASGAVQNNLIGWTGQAGAGFSGSGTWTFTDNEVQSTGQAFAFADGVAMGGAVNVSVIGNRIANSAGFGISSVGTGSRLFEDNSTIANGTGGSELANIYVKTNNATVRKNVVDAAPGPGVAVVPGITAAQVTGNHFTNNGGTSIDLITAGGTITDEREGDGIQLNGGVGACGIDAGAGNDGLDYPVVSSAIFSAGNTRIRGTACPNGTVEIYEANAGAGDLDTNGDPHGEGQRYVGSGPVDGAGNFDVTLAGLALGDTVSAIVIDTTQNTSEFSVNRVSVEEITLIKRAFLPDGTPVGDGSSLPVGVEFRFLLYINNKDGAANDTSVRDVLDSTFGFQSGTIQVDSSVAECAAAICTAAEESAIFASAVTQPFLTDAVDADVASYTAAGTTIDVGNEYAANGQLNVPANSVWAIVFSTKIQ